jgi:hypothetical protein
MAENIEKNYTQIPQRMGSSATAWTVGIIMAIALIGGIWYYTARDRSFVAITPSNSTGTTMTKTPVMPAPSTTTITKAPATGTTTPTPAPAPASVPQQ